MTMNTVEAGCAMDRCLKPASRVGPMGAPAEPEALILTCDDHADSDSVALSEVQLRVVYRDLPGLKPKGAQEPCQHPNTTKGDEFTPDRCNDCHEAVWPR